MRRFFIPALLCAALSGCTSPSYPKTTIADFSAHVLAPLSTELANSRIDRAQTALKAGRWSPELLSVLTAAFPSYSTTAALVGAFRNASLNEQIARLEARRGPLQRELLALFTKRAKTTAEGFAVCVEGIERRYSGENWTRQPDGPGLCETVLVSTEGGN